MKSPILLSFFFVILGISFSFCQKDKDILVLIETTQGNLKVKLYKETPLHQANFIKLVKEHYYDSIIFHRVINEFMIQAGDPDSKGAGNNKTLGSGGPGYTIPAEFNPKFIHKKGALAAARTGDQMNPKKESSGSQFYIVHGKKYSNDEIKKMEQRMNDGKNNEHLMEYLNLPENAHLMKKIDSLQQSNNFEALNKLGAELMALMAEKHKDDPKFVFTQDQITAYTTLGGTPHLDGAYTVFGEVVEGLEVIDKIAQSKTDKSDRPETDVRIISMKIVKK